MKTAAVCAVLVLGLLSGCGHLSEKELPLQDARGLRYECVTELRVCGIKRDPRAPGYDYVNLYPAPGIAGPEVVDLGTIPAGTMIELDGLLQQGPSVLGRVIYRVKIIGPAGEHLANKDVRLATWDRLYAGRNQAGQPILSRDYFRPL